MDLLKPLDDPHRLPDPASRKLVGDRGCPEPHASDCRAERGQEVDEPFVGRDGADG